MVKTGNDALNFQNFQNIFCRTVTFSLTLQACCPEFLTSAQLDSKTNFSFELSRIIKNLQDSLLTKATGFVQ